MPTLAEYSKRTTDPLLKAVVETYRMNSPFLDLLDFQTYAGGSVSFNREDVLPTNVGARQIDGEYTASFGTIEKITESFKIYGGRISVDRALIQMYGNDRLATERVMKTKALVRGLNAGMFKGDGTLGTVTGLQNRVAAGQTIANHATGAGLSLAVLRDAVLSCQGTNKYILVGKGTYNRLWADFNKGAGQTQIMFTPDDYGRPVMRFAGVPIVMAGQNADRSEVLDFSEAGTTSSIYVVSTDIGEGVQGFQSAPLQLISLNAISVQDAFDIEWIMNFMVQDKYSAYRISKITDAAVTA